MTEPKTDAELDLILAEHFGWKFHDWIDIDGTSSATIG